MTRDPEYWREIPDFTNYSVSNHGRIEKNSTGRLMRTSSTQFGHVKVNLISDHDGKQYTRGVALLVAEAFVEPLWHYCDHLILLDGNLQNVRASNLAWRPNGFAWLYMKQFRKEQPEHYHTLPVRNVETGVEYASVVACGVAEGVLFDDVWISTLAETKVFPLRHTYQLLPR